MFYFITAETDGYSHTLCALSGVQMLTLKVLVMTIDTQWGGEGGM